MVLWWKGSVNCSNDGGGQVIASDGGDREHVRVCVCWRGMKKKLILSTHAVGHS